MVKENNKKVQFPKGKSFLLTLTITVVLLIYIPLVIFQMVLVRQSTTEITQSNTEYYVSALHSCANSYNEQMELLRYHALNMSLDTNLSRPLKEEAIAYDYYTAAVAVDSYGQGLMTVAKVGLYYPTEHYVLIDGYMRTMDVFFDAIGTKDPARQEWVLQRLTDQEQTDAFYIGDQNRGTLILARPVHLISQYDYEGVVIFLIDIENLSGVFQANFPEGAEVAVLDAQGNWIMHDACVQNLLETDEDFASFTASGWQTYDVQSDDIAHTAYKYTDPKTGNVYITLIEKENAQKNLTEYSKRVTIITSIFLFLMCGLAVVAVYISYSPIKRLVRKHTDTGRGSMSELELLDSAFFAKDEKISRQRSLLGSLLLGDLIYGSEVKREHLTQEFSYRNFGHFVVTTVVSDEMTATQANGIVESLTEKFSTAEVYTTSVPNRAHTLFILMDEQPIDTVLLKAELMVALREKFGKEGEIKVGEAVCDIEDIRSSYQSSLMDHQNETDVEISLLDEEYPAKSVQDFLQYIYIGDEQNALRMLDLIDNFYAMRKYRAGHRQYYDYKLLSAYLLGLKENMIELPQEEIDSLMAFRNHLNLFDQLRQSVIRCCGRTVSAAEKTSLNMQTKLMQYVHEHLTDIDLCLSSAADELNTSIYVVSRLFKEGFGIGFKEYVITKRLEMAQKLLLTTNNGVTEIARATGFENATYFSTVFRKNFGFSPSKYREKYRTGEK